MANPLREWGRRVAVRWVRWALDAPEGREAAQRAVREISGWRPAMPGSWSASPYEGLGGAPLRSVDPARAVFITARFRTGSTLLWNIFRNAGPCVAYYEPFNERRWFDPEGRGRHVDRSHQGVHDYWHEYDGLAPVLSPLFSEDWARRELYMDASAWAPDLRRYIDALIAHAGDARPILQCNRIDFRLAWIRRWFPGARIVHLYRHPRDQWCSSLLTPGEVPRDITLGAFAPFDHFYLQLWARDLSGRFPVFTDAMPAYQAFYCLWRLSFEHGRAFADVGLPFEDLVRDPRATIDRLLRHLAVNGDAASLARLVSGGSVGTWARFAPDAWFEEQERAAEARIADLIAAPAAAADSARG